MSNWVCSGCSAPMAFYSRVGVGIPLQLRSLFFVALYVLNISSGKGRVVVKGNCLPHCVPQKTIFE